MRLQPSDASASIPPPAQQAKPADASAQHQASREPSPPPAGPQPAAVQRHIHAGGVVRPRPLPRPPKPPAAAVAATANVPAATSAAGAESEPLPPLAGPRAGEWIEYAPLQRGRADYSLVVATGSVAGAGTTGHVSVEIRGHGCVHLLLGQDPERWGVWWHLHFHVLPQHMSRWRNALASQQLAGQTHTSAADCFNWMLTAASTLQV